MPRTKFPVAVHLILKDNEEILLLRRFNTGYEDGNYSVIAGHIDGGEDVYTAMIREALEEAGISIKRKDLSIVQVMHRKKANEERIDYFFECNKWTGEVQNKEPNKCNELRWIHTDMLPENTLGLWTSGLKKIWRCITSEKSLWSIRLVLLKEQLVFRAF